MTARSLPSAQKLQLAYHLTLDCEQLRTSLLVRSLALIELLGMGWVRVAWTDVGGVGVVRRPFLTKIAKFCQGLVHLRLDLVSPARALPRGQAQHPPSAPPAEAH